MHTFKDATGREWRVQLDIAAAFRVDEAAIQCRGETLLLSDPDKWVFPALLRSPALQARVLYQLCRPQAEEEGVAEADFQALLSDRLDVGSPYEQTVLNGAIPALALEIQSFFQSSPTSLNRFLRAQQRIVQLLETAAQALQMTDATQGSGPAPDGQTTRRPDTCDDDETAKTPSTGCVRSPDSTGEPPASPSAN